MSKILIAPRARPVGDKFLVVQDVASNMTATNLQIPETAIEKQKSGTVVASGNAEMPVGSRVMWLYTLASEVKIDGQEYLVMDMSDIAVILPETVEVSTNGRQREAA